MPAAPSPAPLVSFRTGLYASFAQRRDALFDLTDALLTSEPVSSLALLSLTPLHRRRWGSLYAALRRGRLKTPALQTAVADFAPPVDQRVFAVDASVWPRCDAETSPERGYYYHPSRHSAGKPIVAGWSYQWIAQLSFDRDSWTTPLDVQRVAPKENAHTVAIAQIQALLLRLPRSRVEPLFVFDAGYDPLQLADGLRDIQAAILVRLRSNRCFYADVPRQPGRNGRPPRHGAKFICLDPASWPAATGELSVADEQYGLVRVRAWGGLHARSQAHRWRQPGSRPPLVTGTVLLVEVTRLPGRSRKPQLLWLWWSGPGTPDLNLLWRAYVRRFDLEHTFRFLKQQLGWTTPRVRHPEQADRWTWLVVAAYTQLRLAKLEIADRRLPWERHLTPATLTPNRVLRGFSALLATLGTPASPPKPCGRSPGRPKGRRSGRAQRFPAIKRAA
jgi:hypothetical protein